LGADRREARGPDDLSPELRAYFADLRRDVLFAESWITWEELAGLDMTVRPTGRYGDIEVLRDDPRPGLPGHQRYRFWSVADAHRWPDPFVALYGAPTAFPTPAAAGTASRSEPWLGAGPNSSSKRASSWASSELSTASSSGSRVPGKRRPTVEVRATRPSRANQVPA
jgi:hypothetical protein